MGSDEGDMEAAHEETGRQEQVAAVAGGPFQDATKRFINVRLLRAVQLCAGTAGETEGQERYDCRYDGQGVQGALPAEI